MPLLFEFPITLTNPPTPNPAAGLFHVVLHELMTIFITAQYYLTLGVVSIVFLGVVTEQGDNGKMNEHIIPPLSRLMEPELSTGY